MDAAKLRILVEADSAGVRPGLAPGLAALTQFSSSAEGVMKKVSASFSSLTTAQKSLGAVGIGIGLLGTALAASIGPAIQFESAFAGVKKTVDGTPAVLGKIRDGLLEMSRTMPTTAAELAGIAENAGQLGIAAPDVLEFTRTIAMLGETTDLDFDQAAQSLARFVNITGSGAGEIGKIADVIVELGNTSATTESQIVAFSMRLAGAMSSAGATDEAILATAAAYSSLGVEAEAGGSAVSRVMTQIADAALTGNADLAVFAETAGLLPDEFAKIAQASPEKALLLFEQGLQGVMNAGESITPILEQLGLEGIRVSDVLRRGALGADVLADAYTNAERAAREGGAAAEEFARRVETTASQIEIFKNKLNVIAIGIGTPFLGALSQSFQMLGDAIEFVVNTLGPAAKEVGQFLKEVGEGFLLIGGAIGGLALEGAAVALQGIAAALETMFAALNAIPGAAQALGVYLGVIYLLPPALKAAYTGVDFFLARLYTMTGATSNASLALRGLAAAAPIAGIIGIATAWQEAGQKAEEAAEGFRTAIDAAAQQGSLSGVRDGFAAVTAEIDRANQSALDASPAFGKWGAALVGSAQAALSILPGVEATILNNARAIDTLEQNYGRGGNSALIFEGQVAGLARVLGVSEAQAFSLAAQLGQTEALFTGNAAAVQQLYADAELLVAAQRSMTDSTEESALAWAIFYEAMANGESGIAISTVAEEVGLLESSLLALLELEGFDMEELLGDPLLLADAIQQVSGELNAMAEISGRSAQSLAEQRIETAKLMQATAELGEALEQSTQARAARLFQMDNLIAAERAYLEAQTANAEIVAKGVQGSAEAEAALRALADSQFAYQQAIAATGAPIETVTAAQASMKAEFLASAEAMGVSKDRAEELWIEWAKLSDADAAKLIVEGEETWIAAEDSLNRLKEQVLEMDGMELILEADAEIYAAQLALTELGDLIGGYDGQTYAAEFNANTGEFKLKFAEIMLGADLWDATEAKAFLDLDDSAAAQKMAFAMAELMGWDALEVQAFLGLIDGASLPLSDIQRELDGIKDPDPVTVRADIADALAGVQEIARVLGLIKDKTVTVSVRGGGSGVYKQADGGIMLGGVQAFARGGVSVPGATPATPGTAGIYSPMPVGRLFAEPETGGEAYIPLSPRKRGRSLSIWRQTGKLLGAYAEGGISGVRSFADGGIASGSFLDVTGVPIRVDVAVNGIGLGTVSAELSSVASSIDRIKAANAGLPASFASSFGSLEQIAATSGISLDILQAQAVQSFGTIATVIPEAFTASFGSLEQIAASTGISLDILRRNAENAFGTIGSSAVQEFTQISSSAEETGRKMALAMSPREFVDSFSRISGWAKDAFVATLGAWDGTVAQAIQILDSLGLETKHIFEEMANDSRATGTEITSALEQAGIDISGIAEEMGRDMAAALEPEAFRAQFERITQVSLESFAGMGEALAEQWDGTTEGLLRILEDLGVDMGEVFVTMFEEGASNMEIFDAAIQETKDNVQGLEDGIRTLRDAMELLNGGTLGLIQAQNDVTIQMERLNKETEDLAENTNKTDADMARFVDTLIRTGEKYVDLAEAVLRAGGSLEDVNAVLGAGEEALRKAGREAGLSAEQIDILVESILKIPEELILGVEVESQEAEEAIERLRKAFDILTGPETEKEVEITADAEEAQRVLEEVVTQLGILTGDETVKEFKLSADTEEAKQQLEDLLTKLQTLIGEETPKELELTADSEAANTTIQDLITLVETLIGEGTPKELVIDADTTEADGKVETIQQNVTVFVQAPHVAKVDADTVDAETKVAKVSTDTQTLVDAVHLVKITGDNIDGLKKVEDVVTSARGMADGTYNATLTATNDDALTKAANAVASAVAYAVGTYNGVLTGTNTDAVGKSEAAAAAARNFATGVYNASLTATDSASGVIAGARAAAQSFAGVYTATLTTISTTVNRTINEIASTAVGIAGGSSGSTAGGGGSGNTRLADGGIVGGHRFMAGGGVTREAMIARAGSWITWAEDETGGEAYIPLAWWKRRRSLEILQTTAGAMGQRVIPASDGYYSRGSGGIPGGGGRGASVVFAPHIEISGVSDERVARTVRKEIESELRGFSRQLHVALPARF